MKLWPMWIWFPKYVPRPRTVMDLVSKTLIIQIFWHCHFKGFINTLKPQKFNGTGLIEICSESPLLQTFITFQPFVTPLPVWCMFASLNMDKMLSQHRMKQNGGRMLLSFEKVQSNDHFLWCSMFRISWAWFCMKHRIERSYVENNMRILRIEKL